MRFRFALILAALLVAAVALPAFAEGDKSNTGGMDMSQMQPPAPSAEQLKMNQMVGNWKAKGSMVVAPGAPAMTFEGTETVQTIMGGLWTYTTTKTGGMMKMEGHSIGGWDATKKQFVGMWVDSWSTSPTTWTGTFTDDKTVTCTMTGPDMQGGTETMTTIESFPDADHRTSKFYKGTDTSVDPTMTIEYTRIGAKTASAKGGKTGSTR